MRLTGFHTIMLGVLMVTPLRAADQAAARKALQNATSFLRSISINGGYAGIYSPDLKERYGEALYERASATQIWVQPPGTPSVGQVFLRAHRVTGDRRYFEAAREVGRALAWGQRKEGGWDHRVDVAHLSPDAKTPERKSGHCTFDDDITQGATTFLMELDEQLDEAWLDESVELALEFMMEAQFDNGAWPQWYPLRGGYHDYYTYNDNAINDCIRVMLQAHRLYDEPAYLESARQGGDFIIASQLPAPQAGWAQQYSHDLE
ncbi:MAG: pectate lyase, partial [Planctomycetota bacterium]